MKITYLQSTIKTPFKINLHHISLQLYKNLLSSPASLINRLKNVWIKERNTIHRLLLDGQNVTEDVFFHCLEITRNGDLLFFKVPPLQVAGRTCNLYEHFYIKADVILKPSVLQTTNSGCMQTRQLIMTKLFHLLVGLRRQHYLVRVRNQNYLVRDRNQS